MSQHGSSKDFRDGLLYGAVLMSLAFLLGFCITKFLF